MHSYGSIGGQIASSSGTSGVGAAGGAGVSKEVLRGLQDVVWSDDEEDPECPLCMEEMDPSDKNFKPCVCGYQICRFCHNYIMNESTGLCPACRRRYDEQEVQFVPVDPEEVKRLQESKKLKQRINKELEKNNRRPLRDVRIVIKNMVYVVGMKMPPGVGLGEEALQVLRSNEYFGQYGKISKVFLRKTPSDSSSSPDSILGIYITYLRREDAARAISALDGYQAPNNPGKVLKATYGTTKYCLYFLRGLKCEDGGGLGGGSCLGLHEMAGEGDIFTRKDMSALQQTIKNTETTMDFQHQRATALSISLDTTSMVSRSRTTEPDAPALPPSASWATASRPSQRSPVPSIVQPIRRGKAKVLSLTDPGRPVLSSHPSSSRDVKKPAATPSTASTSRPTPNGDAATSGTAVSLSLTRTDSGDSPLKTPAAPAKPSATAMSRSNSRTDSVSSTQPAQIGIPPPPPGLESDPVSRRASTTASSAFRHSEDQARSRIDDSPEAMADGDATGTTPPAEPTAQPAAEMSPIASSSLSLSQSISPASIPPDLQEHASYQPSIQAQTLMDDVMIRRHGQINLYTIQSPYPDFEDLMDCFADGDFTYRLDTSLTIDVDDDILLGTSIQDLGRKVGIDYDGVFDPFVDVGGDARNGQGQDDAARKTSRFGFAQRGEQLENNLYTATSASGMLSALLSKATVGSQQQQQGLVNVQFGVAQQGIVQRSDSRDDASSLTPSSKSTLPYSYNQSRPSTSHGQLPPPPPPGLGPNMAFQQANLRGILNQRPNGDQQSHQQQQHQQQLQHALSAFQQQFQQADARSSGSPVRSGAGSVGRSNGFIGGDFSFQDPAIMTMRLSSNFPAQSQPTSSTANAIFDISNSNTITNTTSLSSLSNGNGLNPSPYPQQSFQTSTSEGMMGGARLLQQFHAQHQQAQGQGRTPSPANGGAFGSHTFRPF